MAIHLEKLPLFDFDENGFGSTGEGERSRSIYGESTSHNVAARRVDKVFLVNGLVELLYGLFCRVFLLMTKFV